ncbi:MAG: phage gp6-like head-tail connector protein [Ignavibacteria bacterium]|nr:phage gp6-like head-tail connector protein [Ignavibacteria bacterium]
MITRDELKSYLQKDEYFPRATDELLQDCINYAVSKIENYCKRKLLYQTNEEIISGNGGNTHMLNNYPVYAINRIYYRDRNSNFIYDLFKGEPPGNNIILEQETGRIIVIHGFVFIQGINNIQINYDSGYKINEPTGTFCIPKDMKGVCYEMAADFFLKSWQGEKRIGADRYYRNPAEGTLDTVEWHYNEKLEIKWKEILRKYVRM